VRFRRGVSTLILGFLIASVLITAFFYLFIDLQRYTATYVISYRGVSKYVESYVDTNLALSTQGDRVRLINLGVKPVNVEYLVVEGEGGVEVRRVSEDLAIGQTLSLSLKGSLLSVITADGVMIYPTNVRVVTPSSEATFIVSVTFNVNSAQDLTREFGVPENMVVTPYTRDRRDLKGMKSGKLVLLPAGQEQNYEWYDATVSTDDKGVRFGVLVVGYDPSWVLENASGLKTPPRYVIMINGPGFTGQDKIRIGNRENPLSGNGFRIRIDNFTGVIKICKNGDCSKSGNVIACSSSHSNLCPSNINREALGAWYYGSTDPDQNLRLYLYGTTGHAIQYMRISTSQAGVPESNYNPYLFIGDVDGNGVIDILFITEDAYYGSSSRVDDLYNDDLSDWSTEPLKLKLLQVGRALGSGDGSIDGSQYSGVYLLMNVIFHDNSHPDEDQLEDNDRTDWVLRVLLVDAEGNEYIIREYRYQEICNYHKTRITDFINDNYFVKLSQSIYIPLPSTGRYWIAVAFQDPYGSGSTNDADLTIGVEVIGVIPLSR